MEKKSVPKRQYTEEFKTEAACLGESVGQHEAARRLGISISTIGNWVRKQNEEQHCLRTLAMLLCPGALSASSTSRTAGCARSSPAPNSISKSCERRRHTSRRSRGKVCLYKHSARWVQRQPTVPGSGCVTQWLNFVYSPTGGSKKLMPLSVGLSSRQVICAVIEVSLL